MSTPAAFEPSLAQRRLAIRLIGVLKARQRQMPRQLGPADPTVHERAGTAFRYRKMQPHPGQYWT